MKRELAVGVDKAAMLWRMRRRRILRTFELVDSIRMSTELKNCH